MLIGCEFLSVKCQPMPFVVTPPPAPPFTCINSLHSLNIDWGFILTYVYNRHLPYVWLLFTLVYFGKHKSYFFIFSIMVEFYGIKTFPLQKDKIFLNFFLENALLLLHTFKSSIHLEVSLVCGGRGDLALLPSCLFLVSFIESNFSVLIWKTASLTSVLFPDISAFTLLSGVLSLNRPTAS